jgi:twitching motility two-component system response regulator PilG
MATNPLHTVALCGFNGRDYNLLASAFRLSSVRPRPYRIWTPHDGSRGPDLGLIADSEAGWTAFAEITARLTIPPPAVVATSGPQASEPGFDTVRRPLHAAKVLKAMDACLMKAKPAPGERVFQPTAEPADAAASEQSPARGAGRARYLYHGRRVLVVDDSESVRTLIGERLQALGVLGDFAASGDEALAKAASTHYDLVLLDVVMPGSDGLEVCRQIKRQTRGRLPVVLLTSRSSRIDKVRSALAQADDHLTKPVDPNAFEMTLQRYLAPHLVGLGEATFSAVD